MKRTGLAARGLRFYRRSHFLVWLGVAIGAAVLTGALLVGDSVRATLTRAAEERVGKVDVALVSHERYFRSGLGARLARSAELGGAPTAAALQAGGSVSARGGAARVASVQILGVDATFFALAPGEERPKGAKGAMPAAGSVALNTRLAAMLDVRVGDEIILRMERPGTLPRDAALAVNDDGAVALRRAVGSILDPGDFGNFGLAAAHVPTPSVFLAREDLQRALELTGKANLLLVGAPGDRVESQDAVDSIGAADRALAKAWALEDVGLVPRSEDRAPVFELSSERVFIEQAVGAALAESALPSLGSLTWFVNSIECGERSTPYSVVSGFGVLGGDAQARAGLRSLLPFPEEPPANSIVLNEWLASDLNANVGDQVTLRYYTVGSQRQLLEESRTLRVHGIVPLAGAAADASWMPDFPGLSDSAHCRDWEPGVPMDLGRLRERDEAYWEKHQGTPKAFVSLAQARSMWATRFGDLTSVRVPAGASTALTRELRQHLAPSALGLWFEDVRGPARRASAPTTDFGVLFLSLSFFLLAGAFLLTGLFFAFGVEQRAREMGTLLALGFTPAGVRKHMLLEAGLVALVGTAVGMPLGLLYTRLVLDGLDSAWGAAVGRASIELSVSPATLALAAALNLVAALVAIAWAFWRLLRRPAHELLSGSVALGGANVARSARRTLIVAAAAGSLALAMVLLALAQGGAANASGSFFGAGALALIAALCLARARLVRGAAREARALGSLAASNAARRPGRSLATVACLASGVFLVVAVGVHRSGAPADPTLRNSGTGGFTLFAESALPILQDLGTQAGQDAYGIDAEELAGTTFVPLRVRSGDDASCLNLATSERPRLVGVQAAALAEREAFEFAQVLDGETGASPWALLDAELGAGVVPAIGDAASVTWALHRKLGDDLEYRDEQGERFAVRIVATLKGSMLQGDLLIAESAFERRFPLEAGYRALLIDTPPERAVKVSEALSRGLGDLGLAVTPSSERLAAFQAVQDTYIEIFQLLGALGVLLGCAGLGVIVLRNANERRGELAVFRAIGFTRLRVFGLLVREHSRLLFLGLSAGALAAAVALVPTAVAGSSVRWGAVAALVAAVALVGVASTCLAAVAALRGGALEGLSDKD